MYNNCIYSEGIRGVLLGHWDLVCETPLVIRNGLEICYASDDEVKTRNNHVDFHWRGKDATKKNECEVASLHYGYEIHDSKVSSIYFIPPSSIRGSLRSWTINQLVRTEYRSHLTPPPAEEEADRQDYDASMEKALADTQTGFPLIASLFGLAFDKADETEGMGNAGRLRIMTDKFSNSGSPPIAINGSLKQGKVGPGNGKREMVVRNPLDRITHASKEGGLHRFLEFCKGEAFGVQLRILNPRLGDLGLVSLWVRELNDGFLRLGALSSIGRGRVRVQKQSYHLWQMPGAEIWEHFTVCNPPNTDIEALAGFWQCTTLTDPERNLPGFEKNVLEEIGG